MDIREFAELIHEQAESASMDSSTDYNQELAKLILEYMEDNGEVNVPELCVFQKTRARLTAYDYNVDAESLDLFYLIKSDTLLGKVNSSKVQQGFNYLTTFFNEAIKGTLINSTQYSETDEIAEVANLAVTAKDNIKQLRLYVMTDGLTDPQCVPQPIESGEGDFVIEFNVWDLHRVFQQHKISSGKEKIEIDFKLDYDTPLQCIKIADQNPYVDVYLGIIPGKTLASIYKKYQQALLEKNVRTFLQFKGAVNKGIRKTLREEPDMFFSYNNGISTTASAIETESSESGDFITKIHDWQIVNGGQTTASIAASINDKEVDLEKVYVPVKISIIHDEANRDERIKTISTTANSQTAIKNSDFSANEPYLVEIENMSRTEWVPNGNNRPIKKWYFERTRGQYMDQLSQLSGMNERAFKIEYPKQLKITKTDIAKYVKSWNQFPYIVCTGAEKNYKSFVTDIKKNKPVVSPLYFKRTVAKGILFQVIDAVVKSKKLGGYKSNMNTYIMASISYLSDRALDFDYIWEYQDVQAEVLDLIEELIPIVWEHLTGKNGNIGEWTKKSNCWTSLQLKLNDLKKLPEQFREKPAKEDGSALNETQKKLIEEASEFLPEFWFGLAKWAKSNQELTPADRKAAFNFGTMSSRNQKMKTLKQAKYAMSIANAARELGYR